MGLALVDGRVTEVVIEASATKQELPPIRVRSGDTFTVNEDYAVTFPEELNLEGDLELNGIFLEGN